jgi:hypothetical protein
MGLQFSYPMCVLALWQSPERVCSRYKYNVGHQIVVFVMFVAYSLILEDFILKLEMQSRGAISPCSLSVSFLCHAFSLVSVCGHVTAITSWLIAFTPVLST